jgi:hypothetical protein
VRIVEVEAPRRLDTVYHRGAATKASAIRALPEGPPVDCFFACRLQIGRGDVSLGLGWALHPRNSENQAVSPPQDGQTRVHSTSHWQWAEQLVDLAVTVGERFKLYAHLLEKRQVKVGQRRRLLVANVPSATHLTCSAASNNDGEIRVIVHVGILPLPSR